MHQRSAAVCNSKPGECAANIFVCCLTAQNLTSDVVRCSQEHVSPVRQSAGCAQPRVGTTEVVLRSRVHGVRPQGPQGGQVTSLKTLETQDIVTGCESGLQQFSLKVLSMQKILRQGLSFDSSWARSQKNCTCGKDWHVKCHCLVVCTFAAALQSVRISTANGTLVALSS